MFFSSLKNCKSCHRNQKHWAFQPSGHPTAVSGHLISVRSYTTLHSRVYIGRCTTAVCWHNGSNLEAATADYIWWEELSRPSGVVQCGAVISGDFNPLPWSDTTNPYLASRHSDQQHIVTIIDEYSWTLDTVHKHGSVHSIQQAQFIVRSIQQAVHNTK